MGDYSFHEKIHETNEIKKKLISKCKQKYQTTKNKRITNK